jgi:hypothetical protein
LKVLVFSDVHGKPKLIVDTLRLAGPIDKIIYIGDVCDVGTTAGSVKALKMLDMFGSKLVYVVGNHEIAHVFQEDIHPYDYTLDITDEIAKYSFRIQNGIWKYAYAQDDFLITHAGLSLFTIVQFMPQLFEADAQTIADYLNNRFASSFKLTDNYHLEDSLDGAGNWRLLQGDHSPLWYRPTREDPPHDIPQIVGHTPHISIGKDYVELLKEYPFYVVDPYGGKHDEIYPTYVIIDDGVAKYYRITGV